MGKRRNRRVIKNTPKAETYQRIKMINGVGYSNKNDVSFSTWNVTSESPDNDILWDLDDLRAKSRNLYMNK